MTSFSPFFPNLHSKGFHSALRHLFPANKEHKNPFVTLPINTVKPKSIKDVEHLPLPQAPGFSDLSDCYLPPPCHSQPVRVSPEVQHPCGAFSWEKRQEEAKYSQQCLQEKLCSPKQRYLIRSHPLNQHPVSAPDPGLTGPTKTSKGFTT